MAQAEEIFREKLLFFTKMAACVSPPFIKQQEVRLSMLRLMRIHLPEQKKTQLPASSGTGIG
jgi:hypothetical protein